MSKFGYAIMAAIVGVSTFGVWKAFRGGGGEYDPKSIEGLRILITGASSGIGEELAYQYCKLRANVVVTARRGDRLRTVVRRCEAIGAKSVSWVTADMSKPDDRKSLARQTLNQLGGLDQLILNHANIKPGGRQLFGGNTSSSDDVKILRDTFEVNFLSHVDVTSILLPSLAASRGSVGVVSALGGKIAVATMSNYSATKFALHGFFAPLGHELRLSDVGVSVTLVVLGAVDTEAAVRYANETYPGLKNNSLLNSLPAPVDDTAKAIVRGVTSRQREIYYPASTYWLVQLHKMFPQSMEEYVSSALYDAMTPKNEIDRRQQK